MNTGQLYIIRGPMMAGKTTELLKRAVQFSYAGKRCIVINSIKDTRDEFISTHNPLYNKSIFEKNTVDFAKVEYVCDAEYAKYDVVCIDEAQFFLDLKTTVMKMVESEKKIVIVSGLDSDFRRQKFGQILDLVPVADETVTLHSYCCGCSAKGKVSKAMFSSMKKKVDVKGSEVIGGSETYEPLCRECYVMMNINPKYH